MSEPESSIANNAPNYGAQGTFYGPVSFGAPSPAPSLEEAQRLLASLPLDDVPQPQNLPTPHRMPLRPNPLFVGRDDKLRELARLLRAGGTVAITTGIGGMGKTQLAAELAHRYGAFFAGGVFWVSCAEPAGIPGEVVACGRLLGLPLDGKDQEAQVQITRAAWAEPIPRLLIFDNCEEEATLRRWLPTSGGARVLVTSRRASWSATLKVQPVPLAVLERGASMALLQGLAPRLTAEEAGLIAAALGDLPLALHLAGSYLARYPLLVADYLARLASVQLQHPSLTGRGVEDMPTNREPHVERAFALSLARLDASNPTDDLARQLLARAACFAPGEPFRRAWLEATVTPEGDDEAQMLARTDAVERLLTLGLLEQIDPDTLRLHRLLVAYASRALDNDTALPVIEQRIITVAYEANGTGLPQAMQLVLTHLRHGVQRADGRGDEQAARLLNELGSYLKAVGAYAEALPFLERALDIREVVLGERHPDTARSLNNLAGVYQAQGQYGRALPFLERALAIREAVLGMHHPDTARSLNNLAGLYQAQGQYARALPHYERALDIREAVLGKRHPDVARSLNNLAYLYQAQGQYAHALPFLERALMIYEAVLGERHPDTARSLNNLAVLYQAQGEYVRALPFLERALAIYEAVLGMHHPDTARSLNNLAGLYQAQGEYARALPFLERALDIREAVLGERHPDTASSLNNLAYLLQAEGEYARALPLYERALMIYEAVLGERHPDTARSLNNLAGLYQVQGEYGRALPLYERALVIQEEVLGERHPHTANTLYNLARFYEVQGVHDQAFPHYHRALTIYQRALDRAHPRVRACRAHRRSCLTKAFLGPLPPADNAQRTQVLAQAQAAIDAALTDPDADRRTLATAIEARARWAEEGMEEGSRWWACAQELRARIAHLGVEPDDPDAVDEEPPA